MYYNKILRIWIVDPLDYFLISAIFGSILASYLRDYLSEKKSMERLKSSIVKKSEAAIKSDGSTPNSKKIRVKKICRLALENRGGQLENLPRPADHEFFNEVFQLAQEIRGLVERLASFLKEKELKGTAKIFFKNGRLLLELILYKCRINMTYSLINEGLSTQVIVMTATTGGLLGFAISWFKTGVSLVAPPVLISSLLIRSVAQQIRNLRDYSKFKKLVNQMLDDDELKKTIKAFFIEGEVPTITGIEMKPWDSEKNPLPEFNFDPDQTIEEFIKDKMKKELGLVENPTSEQIKKIVNNRKIKNKGKTVYFKDLIKKIAEDPDDIVDAEIVKKVIQVKLKNEEF